MSDLEIKAIFEKIFEEKPQVSASAPGRVNLIGEHTDYNGGFVLPMAIPQRTQVEILPRGGNRVCVASAQFPGKIIDYQLGDERRSDDWADYVRGVTWTLARDGYKVRGFDVLIDSHVPVGSGLSSSAALEVAMMRGLRQAFSLDLSDVRIAQLGQLVENDFVGARVGIMDQMASSLADDTHALFLDTRDLSYRQVALPSNLEIGVINSGIAHRNVGGGYNERRAQCEQACERLGIGLLRELDVDALSRVAQLFDPIRRRAKHVITENARVLAAIEAMEKGDAQKLGRLFVESHASMRDDYEVSIPEIDRLVEIACAEPGVYGARLTGGGFGGSIVFIAEKGKARGAAERIATRYQNEIKEKATVLVP